MSLKAQALGSARTRFCYPYAVRLWAKHCPSWNLSFFICKMETVIGSVLQDWEEVNKITQEKGRARCLAQSEARSTLAITIIINAADEPCSPISPLGISSSSDTGGFPQKSPEKLLGIPVAIAVMALGPTGWTQRPQLEGTEITKDYPVTLQMEQQRRKGPALIWDKRQRQSHYCPELLGSSHLL